MDTHLKRDPNKSRVTLCGLASQVTGHHFSLILFLEAVTKSPLVSGGGEIASLDGLVARFWKSLWDPKHCCLCFMKMSATAVNLITVVVSCIEGNIIMIKLTP